MSVDGSRLAHVGSWNARETVGSDAERVVTVPVASLKSTRSFREGGIREDRVEALLAAPDEWTPIVVARSDWTIIDGRHRVVATRRLGLTEIAAEMFDGDPQDAFVEFVRRNLHHGVGLNRRERQKAARRILCSHPDWSDRRIGELCGISPKTVAHLRRRLMETFGEGEIGWVDVRVGRDGRVRPVDPAASRAKIIEALEKCPDSSLRVIAKAVGVSPETVRSVRARLGEPETPGCCSIPPIDMLEMMPPRTETRQWEPDVAFTSREDGAVTAEFFATTNVNELELERHTRSVPLSRVYEVADEARRRAAFWSRLAENVEARAKHGCR